MTHILRSVRRFSTRYSVPHVNMPLPKTMSAAVVHKCGAPSAISIETLPVPTAGPGQVLVRNSFAGVNFLDTYMRSGRPPYAPKTPFVLGVEGSGRVEVVGEGVTNLRPGDRVGYVVTPAESGSCAHFTAVSAQKAFKLADAVSLPMAAGFLFQGLTAQYLLTDSYAVKAGDVVLVHAAAGGLGQLLCQVCKALNAKVIGTVSTEAKIEAARAAGAEHVIVTGGGADWVAAVKKVTGGAGVNVVYDGVGAPTFEKGFEALRTRGTMVLFGGAGGAVHSVPLWALQHGSKTLARPSLFDFIATPHEYKGRLAGLLKWIKEGTMRPLVPAVHALSELPKLHAALEGRTTTGKIIVGPWEKGVSKF